MEQVVKITWFAAILTSSFINLNDSHNVVRLLLSKKNVKNRSFVIF